MQYTVTIEDLEWLEQNGHSVELKGDDGSTERENIPEETLEELSEFGSIMISEVLQRVTNIDTKLISVLALSAAMLGFDL
jgi:hypothetical protein